MGHFFKLATKTNYTNKIDIAGQIHPFPLYQIANTFVFIILGKEEQLQSPSEYLRYGQDGGGKDASCECTFPGKCNLTY